MNRFNSVCGLAFVAWWLALGCRAGVEPDVASPKPAPDRGAAATALEGSVPDAGMSPASVPPALAKGGASAGAKAASGTSPTAEVGKGPLKDGEKRVTAGAGAPAPQAGPPKKAPLVTEGIRAQRRALKTFYDGLAALEAKKRSRPVRIMWLGDSHAQADFWTGEVRRGLQLRFGDAGPGFVHLGFKAYRHDGIRFDISGKWRMRPKAPSTTVRWRDGAYGLGGILHAGFADLRYARMQMKDASWAKTPVNLDLCYKFGLAHDRVRLSIDGKVERVLEAKGKDDVGTIRHLKLSLDGWSSLEVRQLNGRTDFCGVVAEVKPSHRTGVVLDNLGINGARYGTALAWDGTAWANEVLRRTPELFVFEYGGNEASDIPPRPELYLQQARKLIRRTRYIRRDVSCLVVGPSDRVDAEDRIPPIVQALKKAAEHEGCMFWNTYEKMGGKGSLRAWRAKGLASEDGVHLKPKGYLKLGRWLLDDLLAAYGGHP